MTTTPTLTLTAFLEARIAEDEAWAREAGRHGDEPLAERGEHWRWECPDDEIVKPNTDVEFMECSHEHWSMSLRSIEQYPYRSIPGEGPSIHLTTSSELTPVVAAHIARHDPARVLAECEAKRAQIEHLIRFMEGDYAPWNQTQLGIMAAVYSDHPDYNPDWA